MACFPTGLVRTFHVLMPWHALRLFTSTATVPGPDEARVNKPALGNKWGGWKVLALKSSCGFYLFLICCAGAGNSLALSGLPFAHLQNARWGIVAPKRLPPPTLQYSYTVVFISLEDLGWGEGIWPESWGFKHSRQRGGEEGQHSQEYNPGCLELV